MTKRGPYTIYYRFTGTNKSVYGPSIYSLDALCLFISNTVPNSCDLHTKIQSQQLPFSSFPSQDIFTSAFLCQKSYTHTHVLTLPGWSIVIFWISTVTSNSIQPIIIIMFPNLHYFIIKKKFVYELANKGVLHSTGNNTRCLIMSYKGRGCKKKRKRILEKTLLPGNIESSRESGR